MGVTAPYRASADQRWQTRSGRVIAVLAAGSGRRRAAQAQFDTADNMTQQFTALTQLLRAEKGDAAIDAFQEQWHHDRLVMDKWFGVQVGAAKPDVAVDVARKLVDHPAFDMSNPNRFRAVMGGIAMNHAGFHRKDGAGYAFLCDWLIKLDDMNPQTTARMCSVFQTWKRYDAQRQALIKEQLERIKAKPGLSRDTDEMITRILG